MLPSSSGNVVPSITSPTAITTISRLFNGGKKRSAAVKAGPGVGDALGETAGAPFAGEGLGVGVPVAGTGVVCGLGVGVGSGVGVCVSVGGPASDGLGSGDGVGVGICNSSGTLLGDWLGCGAGSPAGCCVVCCDEASHGPKATIIANRNTVNRTGFFMGQDSQRCCYNNDAAFHTLWPATIISTQWFQENQ